MTQTYKYERLWHPQPHQVKQNAIDLLLAEEKLTLAERQARAREYYKASQDTMRDYKGSSVSLTERITSFIRR